MQDTNKTNLLSFINEEHREKYISFLKNISSSVSKINGWIKYVILLIVNLIHPLAMITFISFSTTKYMRMKKILTEKLTYLV